MKDPNMADDPNPELRAELEAALAVLEPQIRGLHDLANDRISNELLQFYNSSIAVHERRRDLILRELTKLDDALSGRVDLENDGYPSLPTVELPNSLFQELQEQVRDISAGAGVFELLELASQLKVTIGTPEDKS